MDPYLVGSFVGAFSISFVFAAVWLIIAKFIPPLRTRPGVTYTTAIILAVVPQLVTYGGPSLVNFGAALACIILLIWQMKRARRKLAEDGMFGFGGNRELKDLAHKIGQIWHHQLTKAMEKSGEVFNDADEIAFTSGYLKAYFHQMFQHYNNSDQAFEGKLFRKTCDGVIPNQLWDIYLRGEELGSLAENSSNERIIQTGQAYERGIIAGVENADETHIEGKLPSQLTNYLSGNFF